MSVKKSIGWCDITRNPIKGRCKGGCWYCYYSGKRGMLNRLKVDPEILINLAIFDKLPKKPKRIFLCSTHDLFGSWIPHHWRDMIFQEIAKHPQHTFQILTKFPQNIDRNMPHNVWLGMTVPNNGNMINTWRLGRKEAKIRFVSIEPLLERIDPYMIHYSCNWIIVGRLTGYGHQHDPEKGWIEEIVWKARERDIPIFLKDNLKEIWGENLIQEFPK